MRKRSKRIFRRCSVEVHRGKIRLRYYGLPGPDGKRPRIPVPTGLFPTPENKEQARKWARTVAALLEAGTDPTETLRKHFVLVEPTGGPPRVANPPMTVRDGYDWWLACLKEENAPLYRRDEYAKHFEPYILPEHGAFPLPGFEPADERLVELQRKLLKQPLSGHALKRRRHRADEEGEGRANLRTTLSVKAVKNILSSYRAFCRDAVAKKKITGLAVNPFIGLTFKWEDYERDDDHMEPDPFTVEERDAIIDYFLTKTWTLHNKQRGAHLPFAGYVIDCFFSGKRPSEVGGTTWGDIDFAREQMRVRRRYRAKDYGTKLKTKAARRDIDLPPNLADLLRTLQKTERVRLGRALKPTDVVYTNLKGEPIRPGAFSELWYEALRTLGIRLRGLYQTKHTLCSLTVALGDLNRLLWLEKQTGEPWTTLRAHYAARLPTPASARPWEALGATAPVKLLSPSR